MQLTNREKKTAETFISNKFEKQPQDVKTIANHSFEFGSICLPVQRVVAVVVVVG